MKLRDYIITLADQPLALHEPALGLAAQEYGDAAIEDLIKVAAIRANPRAAGAVAVVPLIGFVQQREDIWTRMGFATSTERFTANVAAAVADPGVKAVVLDIDSPGGVISGTPEAADAIYRMRGSKPIIAVSNGLMASAAYWIGSAADEVISSPSSYTGSIGVWTLVADETAAWEALGVKLHFIKAGKWKAIGNPWEPLSEEGRERIQGQINDSYDAFVKAVARNRGAKVSDVRAGYGEGDVLAGEPAKAAGLVDRIATLNETLARFGGVQPVSATARAEAQREIALARFRAPVDTH